MTIAEIHGKISDTGYNLSERMEDLLTSDVFGCMRYLPPDKALIPFLQTARSFHGNAFVTSGRIVKVHYTFWPRIKSQNRIPCEPDVVLGLETKDCRIHLVMVEAKYYSGLSSEEDERQQPNDQLARELDNLDVISTAALGWKPQLDVISRTLLFITQDMKIPQELLAQSCFEYNRKRNKECDIFWTSWKLLPPILEKNLESEYNVEHRAVIEDMLQLLQRKWLIMFCGIEPISQQFRMSDFEFYRKSSTRYLWPDISKIQLIPYAYKTSARQYAWPNVSKLSYITYVYKS